MTHEVDTNLVRANIRRKDDERLKKMKFTKKEPLYSVVRRLIDTQDTEKADMAFLLEEFRHASATWKTKYDEKVKELDDTIAEKDKEFKDMVKLKDELFVEMVTQKDKQFVEYKRKVHGTLEAFIHE